MKAELRVQIAGTRCTMCGCTIVLATEGKACPRCRQTFHEGCESATECRTCGQSFEKFTPDDRAPSDTVLPRALRGDGNESRLVQILIFALPALLLLLFVYWLFFAMATGH